jgi:hypothetical protein
VITPDTAACLTPGRARTRRPRRATPSPSPSPSPSACVLPAPRDGACRQPVTGSAPWPLERRGRRFKARVLGQDGRQLAHPRTNRLHRVLNQIGHSILEPESSRPCRGRYARPTSRAEPDAGSHQRAPQATGRMTRGSRRPAEPRCHPWESARTSSAGITRESGTFVGGEASLLQGPSGATDPSTALVGKRAGEMTTRFGLLG